MLIVKYLFAAFLLGNTNSHDLYLSICEMEQPADGLLEIRYYLFHDDLKMALYNDPTAPEIHPDDAQRYIAQNTQLLLNGELVTPTFQTLDYRKEQVRLSYQVELGPGQILKKIDLTDCLLIEHFRTQVNMVYFVKPDGDRLVQMLDAGKVEAVFEL